MEEKLPALRHDHKQNLLILNRVTNEQFAAAMRRAIAQPAPARTPVGVDLSPNEGFRIVGIYEKERFTLTRSTNSNLDAGPRICISMLGRLDQKAVLQIRFEPSPMLIRLINLPLQFWFLTVVLDIAHQLLPSLTIPGMDYKFATTLCFLVWLMSEGFKYYMRRNFPLDHDLIEFVNKVAESTEGMPLE